MPENFDIAHKWIFLLLPLPLLVYALLPPLRLKSASLRIPSLSKTEEITGQKSRRAAEISKKSWHSLLVMGILWVLLLASLSSPRLLGEPELKVKSSRTFLIVADISFSMANTD